MAGAGAGAEETKKASLKLWIDNKANKVVFAEADKDFVDFICDILCMPINSVVKLLSKDKNNTGLTGTLGNAYKSIEELSNDYILPNINKEWVLKPPFTVRVPLLSLLDSPASGHMQLYSCVSDSCYTDVPNVRCFRCYRPMGLSNWRYIAPPMDRDGYVKGVVKYMVMDNLEVKPLSMALIKYHFDKIASLLERDVELGPTEGVAMLKASFETQAVLTAVFLQNKIKTER